MRLEERRAYYRNYMCKPRRSMLTGEPVRRREAPCRRISITVLFSTAICAFCHVQIDGRVYRKGNAKLHPGSATRCMRASYGPQKRLPMARRCR